MDGNVRLIGNNKESLEGSSKSDWLIDISNESFPIFIFILMINLNINLLIKQITTYLNEMLFL